MLVILSSGFVEEGLSAEVGLLPPSMLPVGNKRLYEYQIKWARAVDDDLRISLPASYELDEFDASLLADLGVAIVWVPDGLSLGEAVVYIWANLGCGMKPLRLLHGDTLLGDGNWHVDDCLVVAKNTGFYHRGLIEDQIGTEVVGDNRMVMAGYFSFDRPSSIISNIIKSEYDFVRGSLMYFGKDPSKQLLCNDWLDFGHANTYYRSKSRITTERTFNNLDICSVMVHKTSDNSHKMHAELYWYESVPPTVRVHAPICLGAAGERGYRVEYLSLPALNELYVYGGHSADVWSEIFKACGDFLDKCRSFTADTDQRTVARRLYGEKTIARLETFAQQQCVELAGPWSYDGDTLGTVHDIISETEAVIGGVETVDIGIMHGDFCLSNILYDFRRAVIRVIDPRGLDGLENYSVYGDIRYDLAKLYHSIIGLYDYIIAGRYNLTMHSNDCRIDLHFRTEVTQIQARFHEFLKHRMDGRVLAAINVQLFLSMLPLHVDDPIRQKALFANALRVYKEYFRK